MRLGEGADASSNTFVVASGGIATNMTFYVGNGGDYCALVVTNGGGAHSRRLESNFIGSGGARASAWIGGEDAASGEKSTWLADVGLIIGSGASANNAVTVASNGVLVVGAETGSSFKVRRDSAGNHNNTLAIERGGEARCPRLGLVVGGYSDSHGNKVVVDGGVLRLGGAPVYIGQAGTNNSVVVRNGGLLDLGGREVFIGGGLDQNLPIPSTRMGGSGNALVVESGGGATNS
jgi:hypothetical protein